MTDVVVAQTVFLSYLPTPSHTKTNNPHRLGNNPREFCYLAQSDAFELNHVDDAEEFRRTLDAMKIIGLTEDDIDAVLRTVAAVLHLGNVTFAKEDEDTAKLNGAKAEAELVTVADLLGVGADIVGGADLLGVGLLGGC